ncbi:MAG: hypothetical protein GY861_05850 [bacterium]|nr:hypothetical protein [bacterium]
METTRVSVPTKAIQELFENATIVRVANAPRNYVGLSNEICDEWFGAEEEETEEKKVKVTPKVPWYKRLHKDIACILADILGWL